MKKAMSLTIIGVLLSFIGAAFASASASEVESLMMGNGNGTSYEGKARNRSGKRYTYQACHRPDGKIVGQSDYGSGEVYHASGRWQIKSEFICVDWSTSSWGSGCYRVTRNGSSYEMTDTANNVKVIFEGRFQNQYFDWCANKF